MDSPALTHIISCSPNSCLLFTFWLPNQRLFFRFQNMWLYGGRFSAPCPTPNLKEQVSPYIIPGDRGLAIPAGTG